MAAILEAQARDNGAALVAVAAVADDDGLADGTVGTVAAQNDGSGSDSGRILYWERIRC